MKTHLRKIIWKRNDLWLGIHTHARARAHIYMMSIVLVLFSQFNLRDTDIKYHGVHKPKFSMSSS